MLKKTKKAAESKTAEVVKAPLDPTPELSPLVAPESSAAKLAYAPTKSGIITVALLIALALVIAGLGITQRIMNTRGMVPKAGFNFEDDFLKGFHPKILFSFTGCINILHFNSKILSKFGF